MRAFAAALLAAAIAVGGVAGSASAHAHADWEVRAPLAASHVEAAASARLQSVAVAPAQRAAGRSVHAASATALGSSIAVGAASLIRPALTADAARQQPLPRRLALRYDATAPPATL